MIKKTRCKFRCDSVLATEGAKTVVLTAATEADDDNKEWSKWTPSGRLELAITNLPASEMFTPGEFYFLDLTPCEPKETP